MECPNHPPDTQGATTVVVRERPIIKGTHVSSEMFRRHKNLQGDVESTDVCSVCISRSCLKVSRTDTIFNDWHISLTTLAASMLLQHTVEKTQRGSLPTFRVPWIYNYKKLVLYGDMIILSFVYKKYCFKVLWACTTIFCP